jgi:hypothetical protein
MKKYKIHWSIWNLVQPTQKEVSQLQTIWAGFSAPIIASALIASNDRNALIAAVVCGLIDKSLSCLYLEEK